MIINILQVIVGLGLLNVWLIRANWETPYRGGNSKNLKQEFATYGLPVWFYYLVGFLKISSALALIVGLWYQQIVLPASAVVLLLMLGAVSMHFKVGDSISKSIPASLMLIFSIVLVYNNI